MGPSQNLTRRGVATLLVCHCAGMIDLAALPLWVGVLVGKFQFDPQRAGTLVSMFLAAACIMSVLLSARVTKVRAQPVAAWGFGLGAVSFGFLAVSTEYASMAVLHVAGGLSVGAALTVTHGAIGRSDRPHRLFAHAGLAFGLFAILFFGIAPNLMAANGGGIFFAIVSACMVAAATMSALAFPNSAVPVVRDGLDRDGSSVRTVTPPLPGAVWCGIFGVSFMALNQAMASSFLQRLGLDRQFDAAAVNTVLVASAVLSILPAPLAAQLERRVSARWVTLVGPIVQLVVIMVLTHATSFAPYAAAAALLTAVQIFTHTFAFGLIARLDKTGRATAATPAMLMVGSALGPFVGGSLIKFYGYEAMGQAAALTALASLLFYWHARYPSASPQAVAS